MKIIKYVVGYTISCLVVMWTTILVIAPHFREEVRYGTTTSIEVPTGYGIALLVSNIGIMISLAVVFYNLYKGRY